MMKGFFLGCIHFVILFFALNLVSCHENMEVSEISCLPQKNGLIDYKNLRFRTESESCLKKLAGINSFSLRGRGVLDVDELTDQPSIEIYLEKGKLITEACTALIWSDSLGNKVKMLGGSAQFQYEGRKIDLYIHSEMVLGEDEVVVKDAEI